VGCNSEVLLQAVRFWRCGRVRKRCAAASSSLLGYGGVMGCWGVRKRCAAARSSLFEDVGMRNAIALVIK